MSTMLETKANGSASAISPWHMENATGTQNKIYDALKILWCIIYNLARSLFRCVVPIGFLPRKNIKNSRVLITGAGNGIGRFLAHRFAKENAILYLWDVDENGIKMVAEECKAFGAAEVNTRRVDIGSREAVFKGADEVDRVIDILVNNAATVNSKFFLQTDVDEMDKIVEINLKAHLWMVKAFLPSMVQRNSGHIVAMCSLGSIVGAPGLVDYCATKFGVLGFMEALQNEIFLMGKHGIHFTYVSPTFTKTQMISKLRLPLSLDILDPEYVADAVMEAVLTNQKQLILPKKMYFVNALKGLLPTNLFQALVLFRDVR